MEAYEDPRDPKLLLLRARSWSSSYFNFT